MADADPRRIERLAGWLDGLAARGAFNGSVLIAAQGQILLAQHCGFADIAESVPLTDRSAFPLASVSKPFTGLAIMLLARRGRLRLDDELGRHVPELAFYRVTLRQMLHHTSGLPEYLELADAHWPPDRLLRPQDLLALVQTYRPPLYFAPGSTYEYNNTGYALLGEIVARASGQSYPAFMDAEIFRPLGMADSAAFNRTSPAFPLAERVYGFTRVHGRIVDCDLNNLDGLFGDGGIYASARDLLRFDRGLREGRLIPISAYAEATASGRLHNGRPINYGFGWDLMTPGIADHWGEWQGFNAYLRRDLAADRLLVLLSNLGPRQDVAPVVETLCAEFATL